MSCVHRLLCAVAVLTYVRSVEKLVHLEARELIVERVKEINGCRGKRRGDNGVGGVSF